MKTIQLTLICAFIGMFVHGFGQQINYENVPEIIRTNYERDYLPQIKKTMHFMATQRWSFDGFTTYKMSINNYGRAGIDELWYNTSGEVVRIEQVLEDLDGIPPGVIEQYKKDYPKSIGCSINGVRKITEGTESVYVLDVDCRASYRVFYSSKGVKNREVRKE